MNEITLNKEEIEYCQYCDIELVRHWQALAGKPVFTWHHKEKTSCTKPKPKSKAVELK